MRCAQIRGAYVEHRVAVFLFGTMGVVKASNTSVCGGVAIEALWTKATFAARP